MTRNSFQILPIVFTVLFAQSALGLKCYICNSANDPECSMSPPPAKYLQECSQDTLEILNDMHRQTKLEEAAQLASQQSGAPGAVSGNGAPGAVSGNGAPGAISGNGAPGLPGSNDAASAAHPPASHPFDKEDKDLTLNRTARGAEEIIHNNSNASKPVAFSTSPINLPKEATFCRKTSYHIPQQSNGPNSTMKASIRVIRSCGWIPEPTKEGKEEQSVCKWIGTEGVQMDQCVCNGDGCNSGNYMGSLQSQTLILLAIMTAGYFYVL